MAVYTINYSDTNKTPITISTGTIDDFSTSLSLIGQNAPAGQYGPAIAENFLHLLENFAAPTPPASAIIGQLWYDTTNPDNKVLRINDGAGLSAISPEVGGIHRSTTPPNNSRIGDIWVDTANSQVYINNGTTFSLVGPNYSSTSQTGSYPDNLRGSDNAFYPVILNYLNGDVISILAQSSFRPAVVIEGFDLLLPGINLSAKSFSSTTPIFNGVAASASALKVTSPSTQIVSANNFFRKDLPQTLNEVLTINNNSGINIGLSTPTFLLTKTPDNDASIISSSRGSNIIFRVDDTDGVRNTILSISGSNKRVGINQVTPANTLDVNGTMSVSGASTLGGSLTVNNNLSVTGNGTIGSNLIVSSTSTFNDTIYVKSNSPLRGGIMPVTPDTVDIGSSANKFNRIWANIIGVGTSTFLYGTADSAVKLSSARQFLVSGQVATTSTVSFDGTAPVNLSVRLNSTAIDGQTNTSTVQSSYMMAVSNPASATLYKTTKEVFLSDVTPNLVKPGFVMASVGPALTPPTGWLWCDGSPYSTAGYNDLYNALMASLPAGSTPPFGDNGAGTFKVPDIAPIYASNTTTVTVLVRYMIKY